LERSRGSDQHRLKKWFVIRMGAAPLAATLKSRRATVVGRKCPVDIATI
jgi:hypothetical protein